MDRAAGRQDSQREALIAGVAAAPALHDPTRLLALFGVEHGDGEAAALLDDIARRRESYAREVALTPAPAARLEALRGELAARGLAGFIVPRSDEHQGEYVPLAAQRLAWLTGFSGSAGLAVVLADRAAVFVDGRYTLQARHQVDTGLFEPRHLMDEPPTAWLETHLPAGGKLGYDPWLHTESDVTRLRAACESAGASLVPCESNPLDAVWTARPPAPLGPVVAHDVAFAGESAAAKRTRLAAALSEARADAAVLTDPASIAWLLNVRGADVVHTPLPLSFAVLHRDASVDLFIDPRKLVPGLAAHLGNAVRVRPPAELGPALDALAAAGKTVRVDPQSAAAWVFDRLAAAGRPAEPGPDPCALPKACKNPTELEGARQAHLRDGAALSRFLAWLAEAAPRGAVDEIAAAERLAALRAENERFQDLSFGTISGAGANGAVIHYHSTSATNRRLEPGSLYLVDSGAQYLDGTTDVTRTVAIGAPGAEERARFTAVLKGHIALARARFPEGTTGTQLDTLARRALWDLGLDYDHGTGHGVGAYLSVHEGPHRISKQPNSHALRPGMIVSNEPGYYKTGGYGIRIENLVAVVEAEAPAGAEKKLLGFETLTRAPIDLALVDAERLTGEERAWLDAYHARVRQDIAPRVDPATAAWLEGATRPLGG